MVRIRLKRMGRCHKPSYRVAAVDNRRSRDGKVLEELGWYDPARRGTDVTADLKTERIAYWLSQGAQPSDTVRDLLVKHGITK